MRAWRWVWLVLASCAGEAGVIDAGTPNDGGSGTQSDAGATLDAGAKSDGVTAADSGMRADAGTATTDAGPRTVVLEWDASLTTGVTYSVYRATMAGGTYRRIASGLIALTYTDTTAAAGASYFYIAKSVDAAMVESTASNEAAGVP